MFAAERDRAAWTRVHFTPAIDLDGGGLLRLQCKGDYPRELSEEGAADRREAMPRMRAATDGRLGVPRAARRRPVRASQLAAASRAAPSSRSMMPVIWLSISSIVAFVRVTRRSRSFQTFSCASRSRASSVRRSANRPSAVLIWSAKSPDARYL